MWVVYVCVHINILEKRLVKACVCVYTFVDLLYKLKNNINMKHISYPKIQQFRNVVANINREITFVGLDENGEAIYDPSIPKPKLTFRGTVKLHGTNAAVCFNPEDGFWVQSRQNIITPEHDNAGFAFFAQSNKSIFLEMFDTIAAYEQIDRSKTISIYGEWAGKGIQKGVGISEIDKSFFIFGVKVSDLNDETFKSYWISSEGLSSPDARIYNVNDFQKFSIEVDFNMPQLSQNEFAKITEEVEKECPISKALGVDNGVGEGVVWKVDYKGSHYMFKVKGEKHSVTKVKKLANVDVEKLNSIQDFVEYAVTKNRFEQGVDNVFGSGEIDVKKLGDLIRWVINDIISEESDTMFKNGLEPKDVNKYISSSVREMFFKLN